MSPRFINLEVHADLYSPFNDAYGEIIKQDRTWGINRVQSSLLWQAVLSEEVGEVAKEVLEKDNEKLREELVQVAAVALNWIKALDREEVTCYE